MIELAIVFVVIVVILGMGIVLSLLGKTTPPQAPAPSTFANTNFTPTQMYLNNAGGTGIALNETSKTLCVMQSSTLPPQLVHFTDLVAAFVLKNDSIIHKTLRRHPKEIAIIAKGFQSKLTAGSGQESMTPPSSGDQTQKIDLCLIIHAQESQLHIVNFLDMDTKEKGILFNKAMVSAKHWYQLLSDLIQQANGQETPQDSSPPQTDSNTQSLVPSVADELTKLSDLLNKNVISQEDFNSEKEKLLARQ